MGGGGRQKRFSQYEPSDDESVLEFQNLENQVLSSKVLKSPPAQDIQPNVNGPAEGG
jgi:hypothetical protein